MLQKRAMGTKASPQFALPLQAAAVCYRWRGSSLEFLLVNTSSGNKWTFPKGDPDPQLSHSRAAEREAWEEAGAHGRIESRHFHLYVHSKGVFWKLPGIQEFVVKAFLLEVERTVTPEEPLRNPTWFTPADAKKALAKGREVKYAAEVQAVVDRAVEYLGRRA